MLLLHTWTSFYWPLAEASQFSGVTVNATCLGKPSLISPIGYILRPLRPLRIHHPLGASSMDLSQPGLSTY